MAKRETHKQISLNVSPEWHKIIKIKAIDRNITMQDYILQAIQMRIESEKKYE